VAAGEGLWWLDRAQASDLLLPGYDFWLIDGRRVMFSRISDFGSFAPVSVRRWWRR
jgi:hypothetical protein